MTLTPHASPEHVNAGITHPLGAGIAATDDRIDRWLGAEQGERTLLATSSPGHREMLLELLRGRGYEPHALCDLGRVPGRRCGARHRGGGNPRRLSLRELARLRVITATDLGMERPRQRQKRRRARDPETIIRELTDLSIGAPVVHEDYGVGRYRGLITLDVDGTPTEFLLLEYAGGDKIYVPVLSLHLVTRYSGASPEDAPLHRLGTDQWDKPSAKPRNKRATRPPSC